jgi:predicted Fe-S protein YdhL (DUF1289 family)
MTEIDGREADRAAAEASPCRRHCTLDPDDLCIGCGRMLDEILEWSAAPRERKIAIKEKAAARLQARRVRYRI